MVQLHREGLLQAPPVVDCHTPCTRPLPFAFLALAIQLPAFGFLFCAHTQLPIAENFHFRATLAARPAVNAWEAMLPMRPAPLGASFQEACGSMVAWIGVLCENERDTNPKAN
jgi:hypothetical protein